MKPLQNPHSEKGQRAAVFYSSFFCICSQLEALPMPARSYPLKSLQLQMLSKLRKRFLLYTTARGLLLGNRPCSNRGSIPFAVEIFMVFSFLLAPDAHTPCILVSDVFFFSFGAVMKQGSAVAFFSCQQALSMLPPISVRINTC